MFKKCEVFSLLFLTENLRTKNIGRELVFSADLWYNEIATNGMGFARSVCNTNAKLAIKQNDK